MEESNFDRLVYKYLHNQLSDKEKEKFTAWLDVLQKENNTDLELSKADEEKLFQKITSNIDSVEDVVALYPRKSTVRRLFSKQWVQIAATVIILLSVSFTVWNLAYRTGPEQATSSGKEKLILNDGTIVWVKEGSKFWYYEKEGERHANLSGEALFEVAKMPDHPFSIACGDITVRVVGTSFNLKTEGEQVELNVLTGKVKLTSVEDKTGIEVLPNETVIYTTSGNVQRIALQEEERHAITSETEYNMLFDNATMDEVIKRISKKFNVTVKVSDKNLYRCHLKADLTDISLENSLVIMEDALNITYKINGDTVTLSGPGCD